MDNGISSINFKIVSLNVRGLNNSIKRRKIFKWLHRQNAHCCFLQETFSTEQSINVWRSEWGGNIFYSHGSNHSKGVMILVNPRYQLEVIRSTKDKNGRSIILEIKLDNQNLVLANVYAPNDITQQIKFFQELNQALNSYPDNNLIIGGDFNCALTPKDRKSAKQGSNKHTVINEIGNLCSNFALTDIWRELNPHALTFTWRDKAFKSQSRLDFFLITADLVYLTKETNIMHTPFSDHSAIMLNIQSFDQRKKSGPGFWKFNASLLEDKEYVEKLCANIPAFIEKYKDVTDLGLKWDVIKMEIRSFTVQYSKRRARSEKDEEKQLLVKLNDLQEKLCSSRNDHNLLNEYYTLKAKLDKLLNKKIKGTILRSKARWYENGEKNSKYFLNLEKRNFLRKKISKLTLSNGEETDDQNTILDEEKTFYKNLYSTRNVNPNNPEFDGFFNNNLLTPLNEDQSKKCEGLLTERECFQALKDMDNGKTPGSDGFTCEFYKFFWDNIKQNVIASINYGFEKRQLSICQRRGIITLVPKKDKPTNLLGNLRPISLLNTDYKIATKAIAKRLEAVLPHVINADQTGYIKGRYIGENVRLISDIISYTATKNLPGLAVFLDFEKAFDSIEWNFLFKALDKLNFGPDFKNWVQTFYCNITSCVTNNGYASDFFNLERGVRQGCPLSGTLFVLGIEILALAIKQNPKIEGIRVGASEIKITQYADDTTVFLKNPESMSHLLDLLEKFERCSGLKINHTKSEAMWLGKWKNREDTPFNLNWPKDSVYALGIHFSNSKKVSDKLNFYEKLNALEKALNNWKRRKLTLLGKINIVKSVGLSKLIYNASVLTVPDNFCDQVNKITFNFIWDNKVAKIKKHTIIGERKNGGLNMIDFTLMNKALKSIWIKRFHLSENSAWTVIPNEATLHVGGITFLSTCNCDSNDLNIKELPLFYERMLQYWFEFKDVQINKMPCSKKMIIWNNKDIKIDNKTIFYRSWFDKRVKTLQDLLKPNSDFYTYEEFKLRYQLQTDFLTYYGVINAISKEYKKAIRRTGVQQEHLTQPWQNLKVLKTNAIHKSFVKQIFEEPTTKQRLIANGLTPDQISKYFSLAFSITIETKLTIFQYKILHDIVFTKSKLLKAKLANSDLCYLCLKTKQDLKHMLVSCPAVSEFWKIFLEWYETLTAIKLELSTVKILYGIIDNNRFSKLTNHLLLIAKYYIYCCSINEELLYFSAYLTVVISKAEIEKQISTRTNTPESYYNKWKPLIDKKVVT